MMSQLEFLQSFVEDLLDLRQIRDGDFSLMIDIFDPKEVIKMICLIFGPQTASKGIEISYEVHNSLRVPK